MFCGELCSGLIYVLFFRKQFLAEKSSRNNLILNYIVKEVPNPIVYAIPASTDVIASFMVFFGLTRIPASVY